MAILTGFTREERARIEARATALVKERGVKCSCGGDERDRGWHAEDCALERAWDAYCDEAADELEEHKADAAQAEASQEADRHAYATHPETARYDPDAFEGPVDCEGYGPGPAVEFTETPEGDRGRERWAEHYEELNGAPEGDWDR